MILYNITTKVDWLIHDEWLEWMKDVNIPGMLNNGFFVDCRVLRILEIDETDGATYAVQYYTESVEIYHKFVSSQQHHQSRIESDKWGIRSLSFSTIMEVVH